MTYIIRQAGEVVNGPVGDHSDLDGVTANQHHAQAHAAAHSDAGADEITLQNLGTGAATEDEVPHADGSGGVTMKAVSGSPMAVLATVSSGTPSNDLDTGVMTVGSYKHFMVIITWEQITAENAATLRFNADTGTNYAARKPNWEGTAWAEAGATNQTSMPLTSGPAGAYIHVVLWITKLADDARCRVTGLATIASHDTAPDRVEVINGIWDNLTEPLDQIQVIMANAYMDDHEMVVYGLASS